MIICVLLCAGYVWAPAPFSLTQQVVSKHDELAKDQDIKKKIDDVESDTKTIVSPFAGEKQWVDYVGEANAYPQRWVEWFAG